MANNFNPLDGGYTQMLREYASAFFRERGINAYYFTASDDAYYPYIVYEFRQISDLSDSYGTKRFIMEIDAFTTRTYAVIDNLLDFLEMEMSDYKQNTSGFFIWIIPAYGRMEIDETEPLKRKRITFEVRFYMKGAY